VRFQDTAQPFTLSSEKPHATQKVYLPDRKLTREQIVATSERMKARAALGRRSSVPSTRDRAERIILEADRIPNCGHLWKIEQCVNCETWYHSRVSCNSRLCEHCSRRYARKYKKALGAALAPLFLRKKRGHALMFVTLSVDSHRFGDHLPDREGFDRFHRESAEFFKLHYGKYQVRRTTKGKLIDDACRYDLKLNEYGRKVKVRRTPLLKTTKTGKQISDWRRWRGSGAVLTSELGNTSGREGYLNNNLHCHALVYGEFIPARQLVASWKAITTDSGGVHIRQVFTLKHAINYVLKYITKPPAITNPDGLAEWAVMLKGVRRLRTSGIFVGAIKLDKSEPMLHQCPRCGGFLCGCAEQRIDNIADHASFSLYQEQRQALQKPPPVTIPTLNATDRLIYQKQQAWDADVRLGLNKELAKWQFAVSAARREHGSGPMFVRSGIFADVVYPDHT